MEVATGLTNNQALDIIEKARKAYGDDWTITACERADGRFSINARHVETMVKLATNPELFTTTTIRAKKLKVKK